MMSIKPFTTPKNRIMEEFFQILNKNYSKEVLNEKIYDFYNKHLDYFNDIESKSGNSLIAQTIDVKCLYIGALYSKEKYKEANLVCEDFPILLSKLGREYYRYEEKYKRCLFWEGAIANKLKRYNKSKKKFRALLELGEITERNKEWYLYGILGIWGKYFEYIYVPIAGIYIIGLILSFFGVYIPYISNTNVLLLLMPIYLLYDFFAEKVITYFVNRKYKAHESD